MASILWSGFSPRFSAFTVKKCPRLAWTAPGVWLPRDDGGGGGSGFAHPPDSRASEWVIIGGVTGDIDSHDGVLLTYNAQRNGLLVFVVLTLYTMKISICCTDSTP